MAKKNNGFDDDDECIRACRKIACALQGCLERYKMLADPEKKCRPLFQNWHECCERVVERRRRNHDENGRTHEKTSV